MILWIIISLFLFLLLQVCLLIVWYKLIKKSTKNNTIKQQDIRTQKYIQKLQKQIDNIEYYI